MRDDEFFDAVYQMWSSTTGAKDRYWTPEEFDDRSGRFKVYAVAEGQGRKLVATSCSERDAEFIAGIHGALPELIRRLHDAVDEADRVDWYRDAAECRIAELELELIELKQVIQQLSTDPPWHRHE